ncbi:hypothetical protein N7494_006425 [Penicillium frequentans]|uniref:Mitochondrial division protein 1 n=1 Tax=Penicillium frequentans TaxID=3151616 RepID=A0AAD6GF90_9EURO|nr:hypothetical protein N7494_006425 [Penicillium glabrum]
MASSTSFNGPNSGFQVMQNDGHITAQFLQSNTSLSQASLNQACLRDLRTTNPYDDKKRIKNTNGGLLRDSYRWILDNKEFKHWQGSPGNRLLWIRGDPGKGKTMLLCGIIEELAHMNRDNTATISFFFCQATDIRINNATAVLRGLIYSLVITRPSLLVHVRSRYDQAGKALFEDVNAWSALSAIFTDILEDPALEDAYIVIDALDECINGLASLLDLIVQESIIHQRVKWIVSSRNWPEIIERLDSTQISPIPLELNEAFISEAVNRFIKHRVYELTKIKNYSDETRDSVNDYLLSNSQGTFLWVSLVCRELSRTLRWNTLRKLEAFPPGLDALYGRMIERVLNSENADICIQLLALVSIVYRPVTMDELCMMIEMPSVIADDHEALSGIIAMCGSFLALRQNTIMFIHQSAKEFLLQEAPNKLFPKGIEAKHHLIFTRSLSSLFQTLQRDIYSIKAPGFPARQVKKPNPDPLRATRYACIYWVEHLHASGWHRTVGSSFDDEGYVGGFLQKKYLEWLEALSILGSIPYGIQAMQKLEVMIQEKSKSQVLLNRARDASRFIQYHKTAIESSPLQVYHSPLIFSPRESLTKMCYQHKRPAWLLNDPMVVENWSLCLQTLEGHSKEITQIAWSPDGSRLASVSDDHTIRIWDPATGQTIMTLKPDDSELRVNSIAWSPDGSQLASASDVISIWDLATGQTMSILEHTVRISTIVWSPDGSRLASACLDTIKIWDPATGQTILVLEHTCFVTAISWSPDGSRLASASFENTVEIWHLASGQTILILEYIDLVTAVAWSPDGSRLASASRETVYIRDLTTGQSILTFEGHRYSVESITWSQDGSRFASASTDKTVRIWDPATGQTISILEHTDWVKAITWSPDGSRLASASKDTINIWDLTTKHSMSKLQGHGNSVSLIAWSHDGSRVASASVDKAVRIWDPVTGQTILRLEHYRSVSAITWSLDGSRLASASYGGMVTIWNVVTGQIMSALEGHKNRVESIAWQQDGNRLASASDEAIRIWDPATGQIAILEGHKGVTSLAWSHDGDRLASASDDTVRIWSPATGQCVSTIHISSPINSLNFLKFDAVDSYKLHTNHGTLDIGPIGSFTNLSHWPTLPDLHGYGLKDDKSWITYNGVKILWLPVEYRFAYLYPSSTLPAKLVIGCSTGGRCIFLILAVPNDMAGLPKVN